MQTKQAVFYKASGYFKASGLFVLALLTILSSSLLAFPYTYLAWFMPIVQFNILLPFMWGMLNATVCSLAIYKFKLRSGGLVGVLIFIFSLAGFYCSWVFHTDLCQRMVEAQANGYLTNLGDLNAFAYAMENFNVSSFFSLLSCPEHILAVMENFYQNGPFWLLKENAEPLNGMPLALLWLLEGLTFLTMSVYFAVQKSKKPFSETSLQWLPETVLDRAALLPENFNKFVKDLKEKGETSWLCEAPVLSDLKNLKAPIKYLTLVLYGNSEQNEHYLSVNLVTKIKHRTKKKHLVKYLKIDKPLAEIFFTRYANDSTRHN